MINRDMLVKAEKIAGKKNKKIKIYFYDGTVLVGYSLGIEDADEDDNVPGVVLAFRSEELDSYFWIRNEQIKDVTLATEEA